MMLEESKGFNNEIFDVIDIFEKLTDKVKKNIIRINFYEEEKETVATGFLCKIYINDNPMPVIITCYHVLNDDFFENNDFLYFTYFLGKDIREAIIDLNIQRIKYLNKDLDITFIEIKKEDNLDIFSFLEMDNSININNPDILYKKVYLLHYPKGVKDIHISKGKINDIIDNNINFLTNYSTEPGSSGAPIIDYKKDLVIGIHRRSKKNNFHHIGFGVLLKYAVESFINEKKDEIFKTYSNLYPFLNTMDMIYIIRNGKPSKLFGFQFIERYKDVCKIIYNGLEYPLTEFFPLSYLNSEDKIKGEFKITLSGIEYVRDMSYMFSRSDELKKVFATRTDFSKIESMEVMFEWCRNLEELSDTSFWNVENVTSMKGLFYMCIKLKTIPGMNKWNPIKVKNCDEMFLGCFESLKPSEASQYEEWKNVPAKIKAGIMKGFTVKNIWSYAIFDNTKGTVNYIKNFFNKKK